MLNPRCVRTSIAHTYLRVDPQASDESKGSAVAEVQRVTESRHPLANLRLGAGTGVESKVWKLELRVDLART